MKTELELNEMILAITNKIYNDYPELVSYLDEMPITIPDQKNPELTLNSLNSYYDSLVVMVKDYEENHPDKVFPKKNTDSSVNHVINMELNNSFTDLLVEVNNFNLSYYDEGESAVPIILLHGFPFDKSMWKGQIDSLKSSNRVIACDIRGFGQSSEGNTNLSIKLFAEDLISFMDKLNIEKAVICGLSMGGFIALNAISRFPERFDALILCDTQCIADSSEAKEKRYQTIEEITNNGAEAFNEKFIKSVFHPESLINKMELVENIRRIVYANSNKIIIEGLKALAERTETCSTLNTINVPTLIICGKEDEVTPLEQSKFMHENIKVSFLKIIDKAGHLSNLEHQREFNKYLHDFLDTLNAQKSIEPNSETLSPKV